MVHLDAGARRRVAPKRVALKDVVRAWRGRIAVSRFGDVVRAVAAVDDGVPVTGSCASIFVPVAYPGIEAHLLAQEDDCVGAGIS